MTTTADDKARAVELRRRAEEKFQGNPSNVDHLSPNDIQELMHELQVHQIELEMQNDELFRARTLLEASQHEYMDLYDFAPVGYCTLDKNGRILKANLSMTTMLGIARENLLGTLLYTHIVMDDRDIFYSHLRRVFSTGRQQARLERQTCELQMILPDDRPCRVQLCSRDIDDSDECMTTITDITVQRQAEDTLRESETHFRQIIETAIDGFWLVDTSGRLLEVNEAYARMSGYNQPELLAMTIPDLEANETPADTKQRIAQIMAAGADRFETRHRRKDGHVYDVAVSVQYLPEKGGRFFCFLQDITDRKQAEDALRQAKEAADKANQAKSVFLSHMSHELRTPLNGILGYVQILKRDPKFPECYLPAIDVIESSGVHLLKLITDILDLGTAFK